MFVKELALEFTLAISFFSSQRQKVAVPYLHGVLNFLCILNPLNFFVGGALFVPAQFRPFYFLAAITH